MQKLSALVSRLVGPSRQAQLFTELLEGLLRYRPDERLTSSSALQHAFFRGEGAAGSSGGVDRQAASAAGAAPFSAAAAGAGGSGSHAGSGAAGPQAAAAAAVRESRGEKRQHPAGLAAGTAAKVARADEATESVASRLPLRQNSIGGPGLRGPTRTRSASDRLCATRSTSHRTGSRHPPNVSPHEMTASRELRAH